MNRLGDNSHLCSCNSQCTVDVFSFLIFFFLFYLLEKVESITCFVLDFDNKFVLFFFFFVFFDILCAPGV